MKIHLEGSNMSRADTLEYSAGPETPPILFVNPAPAPLCEFIHHRSTREIDCHWQLISPEYNLRMLRMWKDNYLSQGQENTELGIWNPPATANETGHP
jgi:hypothetical protein